jgi:predicted ArsR family transcriptional regulator
MREPSEDLKTDESPPEGLEELRDPNEVVTGDRTRDHFLDVALSLREPATVDEIAERAGHGPSAAREYMTFFTRANIVERASTDPDKFRVNKDYLDWRRADRLRREYRQEELAEMHDRIEDRISEFKTTFGRDHPDDVEIGRVASDLDQPATEITDVLSQWRTDQRRLGIVKRALDRSGNSSGGDRRLYA